MTNPGGWGRDRATVAARQRRITYLTGLGWTRGEIAAELGFSVRAVDGYRRKARGGPAPPAMTPEQERQAAELYAAGMALRTVDAELGVGQGATWRLLSRQGLARSRQEAARFGNVEPAHGTRARYLHPRLKCRCVPCADANRAYKRAWHAARRKEVAS